MQRLILCLCLLIALFGCAQTSREQQVDANETGLLYGVEDLRILRDLVEKEQIRFRSCHLDRNYYSLQQARVIHFLFKADEKQISNIEHALQKNPSFEQIKLQFSSHLHEVDSSQMLILQEEKPEKSFLAGSPSRGFEYAGVSKQASSPIAKEGWYWSSYEKNLYGYYLLEPLSSSVIPAEYARLIQYVDCMVDTNSAIFLTNKYNDDWLEKSETELASKQRKPLTDYIGEKMGQKKNRTRSTVRLSNEMIEFASKELAEDLRFRGIFKSCVDEVLKNGTDADDLQMLAGKLKMHELELDLLRSYQQVGYCSQDSRPIEQAIQIAKLAGKVQKWDIFMRAHLNILNDRFSRNSDGSYAWLQRKTYLRELEVLELNVVDLMLGLSLRAKDLSDNHYEGTIWRIGTALSESKDSLSFEARAKAMIDDGRLDFFNRGLIQLLVNEYHKAKQRRDEELAAEKKRTEASRYISFINPK
jgi:hypothetical protein